MDAATSGTQPSYDSGSRGPNPVRGSQRAQGAGPPGDSRPEDQHHQHHHKPFFYIQPSQPYLPMQGVQWPVPLPMPLSYNPYYGYPGFGYGMPMLPNCQATPYVEPPSYILPHNHLHLVDYRRVLNPQYYQTMAYHSRRFRYQHSRETTSSEVQTEPLRTSTPTSGNAEVIASAASPPALQPQSERPSDPTSSGSFVIQTEEVRIECCTTPVGLQLLHSHESAEVSRSFSQEAQRGAAVLQGSPLPLAPAEQSDQQALQVCPDILLVGSPAGGEATMMAAVATEEESPSVDSNAPLVAVQENATSPCNRFIKLPFDEDYLDELRMLESTVWSAEETLVASPEDNRASEAFEEKLEHLGADGTAVGEELQVLELEVEVGSTNATVDEVMPEADAVQDETRPTDVAEVPYLLLLDKSPAKEDEQDQPRRETTVQEQQDTSFESLPAYLPSASWLADFDHSQYSAKLQLTPQKQRTPALLDPTSRHRKLDTDYQDKSAGWRKAKVQRYKPRGKPERRSLSDHECCLGRSYNENILGSSCGSSRKERLCTRCLAKRRLCLAASPVAVPVQRKSIPFQPLQTCGSCKFHQDTAKPGSSPVGGAFQQQQRRRQRRCGRDTEGESSENGGSSSCCCRPSAKWRRTDDPRRLGDLNRPLASKQNLLTLPPPAPTAFLKAREKSCVCGEQQQQQQHGATWQRRSYCHHGNGIQELDENSGLLGSLPEKWRSREQMFLTHRCHAEKSWKTGTSKVDGDVSKSDTGSQNYFTKHRKSQAQSQGTRRKDTRC